MKKTYIIPAMDAAQLSQCLPIATSGNLTPQQDGTITGKLGDGTASGTGLVKGDETYDVWSDDWSK